MPAEDAAGIDAAELLRALDYVRALLAGHAGGLEVDGVEDGIVTVSFTRACESCPNLPMTYVSTVRDTLMKVSGVRDVKSSDVHASRPALRRIALALGAHPVE